MMMKKNQEDEEDDGSLNSNHKTTTIMHAYQEWQVFRKSNQVCGGMTSCMFFQDAKTVLWQGIG